MLSPWLSAGMTGSTQTWGRKQVRSIAACDMIHCDGSSASGRNERQEEVLFLGHRGDRRMDSPTHTCIHPCRFLQFLLT